MNIEDMGLERVLVTGVVLAGGASARMGRSKAALELRGEPLLRRVVRRLRLALPNVLVVGPPDLATLVPDATVLPDLTLGTGPLGGLHTALRAVTTPWVFVVACDMPFVAPALVRAMARLATVHADADAVALRTTHGVEPLHAVYQRSCLAAVEQVRVGRGSALRPFWTLGLQRQHPRRVARGAGAGRDRRPALRPDSARQRRAHFGYLATHQLYSQRQGRLTDAAPWCSGS
jgi:molybdopterin-guanine dinucleotide biosynthesis protein A